MYATSMKDRIVAAARAKARELQEAAKPGHAAPELEEALDAAEGKPVTPRRISSPADGADLTSDENSTKDPTQGTSAGAPEGVGGAPGAAGDGDEGVQAAS